MIKKELLEEVLRIAGGGNNFAEIFVENKIMNSYVLIGGKIDSAISGIDCGLGIRIIKDLKSIYLYTNDLSRANLINLAKEGAIAVENDLPMDNITLNREIVSNNHKIIKPIANIKAKEKIDLLKIVYNASKGVSKMISQVASNYNDYTQNIIIANSEGLYKEDARTRVRLSFQAVAEKNGEKQVSFEGPGGHCGFEFFDNIEDIKNLAISNSNIALRMLDAKYCPSGKMPVIIENGFGGVIFHEACGHSLEATSVAKGHSVFSGRLNDTIASNCVTAIDDGTIQNAWGSANIDDEGMETQKNILIENGILKNYLVDKLGGLRMNMKPNGCSRRESYRFAPTSRMSNTYIKAGKSSLKEMTQGIPYGLYAKKMGGGSVDPSTGAFNFAVTEGYLIRNGEILEPVRGATLIGKGEEILKRIDMVGKNMEFGQGMCGSASGSIPANVGQPAIRVSEITVGGRKEHDNE
jgi:TldD protein